MTPNRKLRTTAIAAMVAVSTVFAGVAPAVADNTTGSAYAQVDAPGVQLGYNAEDGSANITGKVVTDDQLLEATNKIVRKIDAYELEQTTERLGKIFADYNPNETLREQGLYEALQPTEQTGYEALLAQYKEVTATLKQAAQNQYDATASLNDALAADRESKAAFKALVDYFNGLSTSDRKKLNALITAVNANDRQKIKVDNGDGTFTLKTPKGPYKGKGLSGLEVLPEIPANITSEQADKFLESLMLHRTQFRTIPADKSGDQFVNRYYARALSALFNSPLLKKGLDPYDAAQDKLAGAQFNDIIAFQVLQARARAQVEALRAIQAQLFVKVRLLELYKADTLGRNDAKGLESVRMNYLRALAEGKGSLDDYLKYVADKRSALKKEVDEKYPEVFSPTDRENGYEDKDAEYNAWKELRDGLGMATYDDIYQYGDKFGDKSWFALLQEARMKDALYFDENAAAQKKRADALKAEQDAAAAARKEAAEKAAEADKAAREAENARKAQADLQKKVDDLAKKLKEAQDQADKDKGGDKQGGDNHGDDNKFPIVPIAIVGVILAALAALAGHFPVIAGMLPKV